nr:hypothetical protein CFP56_16617 [Quercus suber]
MDTGEAEAEEAGRAMHRPATKCDRNIPCSTCVAANLPCRTTYRPRQKKQRVFISDKYTDTIESIEHQLGRISVGIERLLDANESSSQDLPPAFPTLPPLPGNASLAELPSGTPVTAKSYEGESSLQALVALVRDTIQVSCLDVELPHDAPNTSSSTGALHQLLREIDMAADPSSPHNGSLAIAGKPKTMGSSLGRPPLPPANSVLKLLGLTQIRKQQFFVDIPIFTESEFMQRCQEVYFAIKPYALSTWIIVIVGLVTLFEGLNQNDCAELDATAKDVQENVQQLVKYIKPACEDLRLCMEVSLENCKAIALLLISAASRMCLDMGLHRLADDTDSQAISEKRRLFWFVYAMDKGLAFTSGRTPNIHHYDVTTVRLNFGVDLPEVPSHFIDFSLIAGDMHLELFSATAQRDTLYLRAERAKAFARRLIEMQTSLTKVRLFDCNVFRLYGSFIDFSLIAGDMHLELFSATAQRDTLYLRAERAKAFARRLIEMQTSLTKESDQGVSRDHLFDAVAHSLNIFIHTLLTIVYRVMPPTGTNTHPLQCSEECITSARKALEVLIALGKAKLAVDKDRWNRTISLVPFVPFVALIGHAIAKSSTADFMLCSSALAVITPASETSPAARKLHRVCTRLYAIAELIIAKGASQRPMGSQRGVSHFAQQSLNDNNTSSDFPGSHEPSISCDLPMTQEDWDAVMEGFDFELQNINPGELAAFVEPYLVS